MVLISNHMLSILPITGALRVCPLKEDVSGEALDKFVKDFTRGKVLLPQQRV